MTFVEEPSAYVGAVAEFLRRPTGALSALRIQCLRPTSLRRTAES
jgi:hypothetical protein